MATKLMDLIYLARRLNLKRLIDVCHGSNRSSFARATKKNVNLINLSLTDNEELRRPIGEKLARDFEEVLALPMLALDMPMPAFETVLSGLVAKSDLTLEQRLRWIASHAASLEEAKGIARQALGGSKR